MTPRPLDWRSVERKLIRMRRFIDQLVDLGPFDRARLEREAIPTLAAERIFTLLVELAFSTNSHISVAVLKQAPDSYRESFALVAEAGVIDRELADAVGPASGVRNVLVHAYLDLDQDRFIEAVTLAPDLFGRYVRQVSRWFADRADGAAD